MPVWRERAGEKRHEIWHIASGGCASATPPNQRLMRYKNVYRVSLFRVDVLCAILCNSRHHHICVMRRCLAYVLRINVAPKRNQTYASMFFRGWTDDRRLAYRLKIRALRFSLRAARTSAPPDDNTSAACHRRWNQMSSALRTHAAAPLSAVSALLRVCLSRAGVVR